MNKYNTATEADRTFFLSPEQAEELRTKYPRIRALIADDPDAHSMAKGKSYASLAIWLNQQLEAVTYRFGTPWTQHNVKAMLSPSSVKADRPKPPRRIWTASLPGDVLIWLAEETFPSPQWTDLDTLYIRFRLWLCAQQKEPIGRAIFGRALAQVRDDLPWRHWVNGVRYQVSLRPPKQYTPDLHLDWL